MKNEKKMKEAHVRIPKEAYIQPTVNFLSIELETESSQYKIDPRADFLNLMMYNHKRQRQIV